MSCLKLVFPTKEYEQQAFEYIDEFIKYESNINGTGGLNNFKNYNKWLEKIKNDLGNYNISSGRVPSSTYFFMNESNYIVGMINIRHKLNDYLLQECGHIGYGIRPTERNKGYATEILHLGLKECSKLGLDKVLVTCDKVNIASAKVIIKNNGILENEVKSIDSDEIVQRYWIDVKNIEE